MIMIMHILQVTHRSSMENLIPSKPLCVSFFPLFCMMLRFLFVRKTAWGKVKTSPPVWDSDDPTTSLSPDGLIGTLIFYVEAARNAPSSSSIDLSPSPPLPTLTDSLVSRIIAPALVASYGVNQILAFLVSDVNALGSGGLTDTGRTTLINVRRPSRPFPSLPLIMS